MNCKIFIKYSSIRSYHCFNIKVFLRKNKFVELIAQIYNIFFVPLTQNPLGAAFGIPKEIFLLRKTHIILKYRV